MKPLILITNDDGIDSPGIRAMAEAVDGMGELLIVAPMEQQTSMGRAFPRVEKLGIIEKKELCINGIIKEGYGIYGSPAYAVAHGILELSDRKPDLCLSGINYGENLGTNLTCSGTVGAILEGCTYQIPGIAFSIPADVSIQHSQNYPEVDWIQAKKTVSYWVKRLLEEKGICGSKWLNINMPQKITSPEEYCITKQSKQNYFYSVKPRKRDFSKRFELKTVTYYQKEELEEQDDIYAVCIKHKISVTPIVNDLTVPDFKSNPGR